MIDTRKLIQNIHTLFNKIGYKLENVSDWNDIDLINTSLATLNRCASFEDAIDCAKLIQLIVAQADEIHETLLSNEDYWQLLVYEEDNGMKLLPVEDCLNDVILTDSIFSDQKTILLTSLSFQGNFIIKLINGIFKFDFKDMESPFGLAPIYEEPRKAHIVDDKLNILGTLVLSESNTVIFENNKTDLDILISGEMMGIFPKKFLDTTDKNNVNSDYLLATIDWDILDDNSPYSLAKVHFYEDMNFNQKLLTYLIAVGAFVIYHRVQSHK